MDHVSDAVRPIDATTSRAIRPVIPDIVAHTISCAVVAVVALPALSIAGAPVHGSALQLFLAVAISAVAFLAAAALALGRIAALVGLVVVAVSAWLLAQVSFPAAAWVVAPAVGFGAGLIAPWRDFQLFRRAHRPGAATAILLAGVLVALRALDRDTAMAVGAAVAAVA